MNTAIEKTWNGASFKTLFQYFSSEAELRSEHKEQECLMPDLVYTRVNQKVKAIFKLRGNRDREELPH